MTAAPAGRLGMAQAIDEIDLRSLGRALWRRRRWIIGLTLMVAGLVFVGVNMITPRYRSEARVLIETRDNIFLRPDAEKTTERGTTVDQEAVTSQVQLILSRDLAREVIKTLKLGEKPEFDPVLRGSSPMRVIMGLIGLAKDPMSQTPEERVFKSFAERLAAYQVEKSRVIAVEFDSEEPELAARVANAVVETYLVLQQGAKQEQSRSASAWYANKIDDMRRSVADAEAKVEQYRSKTNLFVGTNNTTLSNQQLGELNAQLSAARAQKADAEAKTKIIREALRNGTPVEFSDIINSELMRRLSEQRVALRAQLAEQSSTLLDQHPRIKELKAQIADLDRQLRGEADRLARALDNDARLAEGKVDSLSASLDQLKRLAAGSNEQDVQLRALERDAKSQRDLLESYLAKYREATARDSIGAASADARVISTAIVSNTPAWPKKLPTVLIAALGTLALSCGFVLSGELLSAANVRPAALPLESSPVESAPAIRLDNSRMAGGVPLAAIEELAHTLGSEGARRVTVLGTAPSMNTPLVAIALARTLAKRARVALVDLALATPSLLAIATDRNAPGIGDLVEGTVSFGQIVSRDRYSSVHVVTAGRTTAAPAEIIGSHRLAIALEALARSYDHVLVIADALPEISAEQFVQLAPRGVLVVANPDDPAATVARTQLLAAGFTDVSVLSGRTAQAAEERAAA